ncbi:MAG TPA: hypothetical protein VJ770_10880 [Stellaceae bacterium]|nr:hypothetical protein [Stellaceae bacterium]
MELLRFMIGAGDTLASSIPTPGAKRTHHTGTHGGAMTMALIYKLVGYDRETEELALEHVIPEGSVE